MHSGLLVPVRNPLRALASTLFALVLIVAGSSAASAQESYEVEADPAAIDDLPEAAEQQDGELVHVVQKGDTLAEIARAYGFDNGWRPLFDANSSIDDPHVINIGDRLEIPAQGETLDRRPLPGAASPASAEAPSNSSSAPAAPAAPAPATASTAGVWDRLAACESSGNWSANTGNGYYGGLQFSLQSWRAVGGSGYPHQASKAEQIRRGEQLRAIQGWGAWPACSRELGLR